MKDHYEIDKLDLEPWHLIGDILKSSESLIRSKQSQARDEGEGEKEKTREEERVCK